MLAVILINTGSPDANSVEKVGEYLAEFLMDEKVIDVAPFFRKLLVKGCIVPLRKKHSSKAYSSIWTPDGAPLTAISQRLCNKLETQLGVPCEMVMRYGSLTMHEALRRLQQRHCSVDSLLLVPLFPHYAMSSYESALEKALFDIKDYDVTITTKAIAPFFGDSLYISSLVESFKNVSWSEYDCVLFSYHSIPLRHLKKSKQRGSLEYDYAYQTQETARLVVERLGVAIPYFISYQSALGPKWLKPSTEKLLKSLPSQGMRRILVICPAFVADNLETLREIDVDGRELFLSSGGETFTYISCLNDNDYWVKNLALLCRTVMDSSKIEYHA